MVETAQVPRLGSVQGWQVHHGELEDGAYNRIGVGRDVYVPTGWAALLMSTPYLCDSEEGDAVIILANSWTDAEEVCRLRELTLLGEYMGTVDFEAEVFE